MIPSLSLRRWGERMFPRLDLPLDRCFHALEEADVPLIRPIKSKDATGSCQNHRASRLQILELLGG
jgi:hypothetical protein